jgi:colanic acid biosynthesis glycosyl transferase WcaI
VGLVTQKPSTLGAIVPSKIYGLMAAGRPSLYIGPAAATPAILIRQFDCGWHFDCGDEAGVAALLLRLLEDPEEIHRKGQNGRRAFIENYDRPTGVARVMRAMGLETQSTC